jgi:hypothetical protein
MSNTAFYAIADKTKAKRNMNTNLNLVEKVGESATIGDFTVIE